MKLPAPIMTEEELAEAEEESVELQREWLENYNRQKQRAKQDQPQSAEILDIKRSAAMLGVSQKWLYRNYKTLPHVLIPSGTRPRIKFRRTDLEEWLSRHTVDWRK